MPDFRLRGVLALAVWCALSAALARGNGDWQHSAERAALEFQRAFEGADQATMQRIAEQEQPGVHMVANALLGLHLGAWGRAEGRESLLEVLRELARRADALPRTRGLRTLVEVWCSYTELEQQRERELWKLANRCMAARQKGDLDEAARIVAEAEHDVALAPFSVNAALLCGERAVILGLQNRAADALSAAQQAIDRARLLPWPQFECAYLTDSGTYLVALGDVRGAQELWSEALHVYRDRRINRGYRQLLQAFAWSYASFGEHRLARLFYEEGLAISEGERNAEGVARSSLMLGAVELELGDFEAALEHLERARREYLRLNMSDDALSAERYMARGHAKRGELSEAEARLESLCRELIGPQNRIRYAWTLADLGVVCMMQGEYDKALECFDDALEEFEGDEKGVAICLGNQAVIHTELGEYAEALPLMARSIEVFDRVGERACSVAVRMQLGELLSRMGKAQDAVAILEAAVRESAELGLRPGEADGLSILGSVLGRHGEFAGALDVLRRAMLRQRELGNRAGEGLAVRSFGVLQDEIGNYETACLALERANELMAKATGEQHSLPVLVRLVHTYLQLGLDEKVLAVSSELRRQLDVIDDPRLEAMMLAAIGEVQLHLGEVAQAADWLRLAVAGYEALADRESVPHARSALAEALERLGEAREAREVARRAYDELSAAGAAYAANKVRVQLARLAVSLGEPDEALRVATEAFALLASKPRGLYERDAFGLRGIARDAADVGIDAVVALMRTKPDQKGVWLGEAFHLSDAARGLLLADRIRQRGDSRVGMPGVVTDPRAVGLEEVQAQLAESTALVLYHFTANSAVALVVDRREVNLIELDGTQDLARKLEDYRTRLTMLGAPERDPREEAGAAELYERLVRPLEGYLDKCRQLLVAPDGLLVDVPFSALLRVDGSSRRRLVEMWEVALVPSATVWSALRGLAVEPTAGALLVGNPDYGPPRAVGERRVTSSVFTRLPGSGAEVEQVSALIAPQDVVLLTNASATREAVLGALQQHAGRWEILHLAGHFSIDEGSADQSGFVLCGQERLRLGDIRSSGAAADLVVLSGCASALGELRRGEGVYGFVHAFLGAGCRCTVVSSWLVADESTRELIVEFYTNLAKRGLAVGAALREAQLQRLRSGGAHPFYWAGFQLWGLPALPDTGGG
ncbi:MAG: CHAT domain-containing protein [Planctomycetota bacterium]